MAQMKDSTVKLFLMIIVGGAVLWFMLPYLQGTQQAVAQGITPQVQQQIVKGALCPDTNTGNLKLRIKNIENTTNADWQAGTYQVWTDVGEAIIPTDTAASDGSYDSNSITCPSKGTIYVDYTASQTNSKSVDFELGEANKEITIDTTLPSEVRWRVMDSRYNNITGGDADSFTYDDYTSYSNNQTITAGDSKTWFVDLKVATTFGAAGGDFNGDGLLICTNANRGYFDNVVLTAITGGAPKSVTVPSGISGTETLCWTVPQVKASESWRQLKFYVHANVDPAYSQSPRLKAYDFQYYEGNDGSKKIGIVNDANSNVGVTDRYITISVA